MSSGMSRRSLFGTFTAAALAPLVAMARAAFGWSADLAKPDRDAAEDSTSAVTTYVYDSEGRLIEVIEPFAGEVTSFTYDGVLPWSE